MTRRGNSRPATPAPSDHLGAGGELKRCCDHVASAAPRCISTRPRPIRPPAASPHLCARRRRQVFRRLCRYARPAWGMLGRRVLV